MNFFLFITYFQYKEKLLIKDKGRFFLFSKFLPTVFLLFSKNLPKILKNSGDSCFSHDFNENDFTISCV